MNQVLSGDEDNLSNYWNYNEDTGATLNDIGGGLAAGTLEGMEEGEESWSLDIPLEEVYEHYYDPESRQATLNYSNTSIDLVNFTDNSLIPVTGYVHFDRSSCFR